MKLKWEVEFEEDLEFVKGAPFRLFYKFHSGTHVLFEELGKHANKGGLHECPNCGACKESVEHVLFGYRLYDTQRQNFLITWSKFFFQTHLKPFWYSSTFKEAVFCLGEKQDMLVNDECSSWYNRVGNYCCQSGTEENKFYLGMGHHSRPVRPTPLPSVTNDTVYYGGWVRVIYFLSTSCGCVMRSRYLQLVLPFALICHWVPFLHSCWWWLKIQRDPAYEGPQFFIPCQEI